MSIKLRCLIIFALMPFPFRSAFVLRPMHRIIKKRKINLGQMIPTQFDDRQQIYPIVNPKLDQLKYSYMRKILDGLLFRFLSLTSVAKVSDNVLQSSVIDLIRVIHAFNFLELADFKIDSCEMLS